MNDEPRDHDGTVAAVRAAARNERRRWWITQCRTAISDARARVSPEPSPEGTEPNQHPSPQATHDDGGLDA